MTASIYRPVKAFHPGGTLREKLEEMEMSVKEFALRTSKPEKTINAVLNGVSSLTPDMSISFEQVTGIPARMWLNLQRSYDEYIARNKKEEMYGNRTVRSWANKFPYKDMAELGWVPDAMTVEDKVKNLFSFFSISSVKAWEDYYLHQKLKVAFRLSLAGSKDPYSVSAWLREGALLAKKMETVVEYDEALLKKSLPEMLKLAARQPDDYLSRLGEICSSVGVKFIYLPYLPCAPMSGCVRWTGGHPCIQMVARQCTADVFWFSFFHEIGHVLRHGKKDVFLEDAPFQEKVVEKERTADAIAAKLLLSPHAELKIISGKDYSEKALRAYAREFNTHPGIIVGRLQYRGIISSEELNDLKVIVNLSPESLS